MMLWIFGGACTTEVVTVYTTLEQEDRTQIEVTQICVHNLDTISPKYFRVSKAKREGDVLSFQNFHFERGV